MSPTTCFKVVLVVAVVATLASVITVGVCAYHLMQEPGYDENAMPRTAGLVQQPDIATNSTSTSKNSSSEQSTPDTDGMAAVRPAAVLMMMPGQLYLSDDELDDAAANDTRQIIVNETEAMSWAVSQQSSLEVTLSINDTDNDVNSTDFYASTTPVTATSDISEQINNADMMSSLSQTEVNSITTLHSEYQESTVANDTSTAIYTGTDDNSNVTFFSTTSTTSIPAATTSLEPRTRPPFTSIASITDVAFFLKKSKKFSESSIVVYFDEMTVNDGYFHNRITFTAPKPGYYWFFFAITVNDAKAHHYQLTVRDQDFILGQIRYRQVKAGRFETIVDSKTAYLNEGDKVEMKSTDPNPNVSWGGYMFNNATTSLCFQVKSNDPELGLLSNAYALEDGWNEAKQLFKVPRTGIYYFSFTVAVPRHQPIWPGILVWHYLSDTSSEKCRASFSSKYHDRSDILSSGCLLELVKHDEVKLLIRGDHGHVNFLGFSHTPRANELLVAWSVSSGPCLVAKDHVIHFRFVEMNVGGCLSASSTTQAVIPVSGTYFLELVGTSQSGNPLSIQLVRNGNPDASIVTLRFMRRSNSEITRSSSAIETLNANDVLTIQYADSHQQGDSFNVKEITFIGLLLYVS